MNMHYIPSHPSLYNVWDALAKACKTGKNPFQASTEPQLSAFTEEHWSQFKAIFCSKMCEILMQLRKVYEK